MTQTGNLRNYRAKRSPARSGEPDARGELAGELPGERPRFVIQRHAASSLHFDLRLEAEGVLVSWAVPKGPSTDPRERRLAIRTEDHPLDYAEFEGRIPDEEYGGGTVVVWDTGSFEVLSNAPLTGALDRGRLKVWLHGRKISGAYSLVRTDGNRRQEQWLLMKSADTGADRRRKPTRTQPESVLSGRVNEEYL